MISNIYINFSALSPIQKELFRLLLCIAAAILLNIFVYFGFDLDGELQEWSNPTLSTLTSPELLNFISYYFTPFFLYTLAKAWALNDLRQFTNIFHFLGNQISGLLYCSALLTFSIAYHMERLSLTGYQTWKSSGLVLFSCGVISFYIVQCAMQNTAAPRLLSVKPQRTK